MYFASTNTRLEAIRMIGLPGGMFYTYLISLTVLNVFRYIVQGVFLTRAARCLNVSHRWMAWIPGVNTFYLFKVGAAAYPGAALFLLASAALAVRIVLPFCGGLSACSLMNAGPFTQPGGFAAAIAAVTALQLFGFMASLTAGICTIIYVYQLFDVFFHKKAVAVTVLYLLFEPVALLYACTEMKDQNPSSTEQTEDDPCICPDEVPGEQTPSAENTEYIMRHAKKDPLPPLPVHSASDSLSKDARILSDGQDESSGTLEAADPSSAGAAGETVYSLSLCYPSIFHPSIQNDESLIG